MAQLGKILVCFLMLAIFSADSFADRGGIGKKKREALGMNIKTSGGFKNNLNVNLKTGLKYTGALYNISSNVSAAHPMIGGSYDTYNSAYTFKKGNNIYYLPYKTKRLVAEAKPGYSGVKMVLKVP